MANNYLITNPVLADKVCQGLQAKVAEKVTWLDNTFGKCFRNIRKLENGRQAYYPAIYTQNREYLELIPDFDRLKNTLFFVVGKQTAKIQGTYASISARVGLIVYVNLATAYSTKTHRALEDAKKDVFDAILSSISKDYSIDTDSDAEIVDSFEDVFAEFSYKEIEQMATMQPYAVFRLNFNVLFNNNC